MVYVIPGASSVRLGAEVDSGAKEPKTPRLDPPAGQELKDRRFVLARRCPNRNGEATAQMNLRRQGR
jgi:hypothetical protein